MEDRDQIKKMLNEGKINSDQAALLIKALRESETRRHRIFQSVVNQRQKRERTAWGFIGVWFLISLVLAGMIFYAGGRSYFSRNMVKAMKIFQEGAPLISQGRYQEAADLYRRGIKKAPRSIVGYSLLAMAERLHALETSGMPAYKASDEAAEALRAAVTQTQKEGRAMSGTGIFFLIVFFVLAAGVVLLVVLGMYNILVKREEGVNESWAQVITYYQRKLDLIPALFEVIKGFAGHEQQTLKDVIEARARAVQVLHESTGGGSQAGEPGTIEDIVKAQSTLDSGLGKIQMLVEGYPQIKADVHYLTIMEQIAAAETAVTHARERFNQEVKAYNTGFRVFPMNVIAAFFHFQARDYFQMEQA